MHRGDEPDHDRDVRTGTAREARSRAVRADRMRMAKIVIAVALLVILVVFIVTNTDAVPVNVVFTTVDIALIWVIIGAALVGGLIALLLGRPYRRALRRYIDELEHEDEDRPA